MNNLTQFQGFETFRTARRALAVTGVMLLSTIGLVAHQAGRSEASDVGPAFTVRSGDVRVECPLTVGGSFEARTTVLRGSIRPGATPADAWEGELVVDLSTLDTGIGLRNQHLRDNYLEIGKDPSHVRAVLRDVRLEGFNSTHAGKGTFSGMFRLHGTERLVSGELELRPRGSGVRVRAFFPVALADFGIAKPRYLGVGVRDVVTVRVTLQATTAENPR